MSSHGSRAPSPSRRGDGSAIDPHLPCALLCCNTFSQRYQEMFETAELGRIISKQEYKLSAPPLREELLQLQEQLRQAAQTQVILLFAGVDGGGKGETINILNEWMDPRWLVTRAYAPPDEAERQHPEYWRYWHDLPPRGRIGMFLSACYSQPILDFVYERVGFHDFDARLDRILAFESALADDGADTIDLGCTPGHRWADVGLAVKELVARGLRISIDSFDPWEVTEACKSGASVLLSVNTSTRVRASDWGAEVVVIPDTPNDEKSFQEPVLFCQLPV